MNEMFTLEELSELFGGKIPIVAVKLLFPEMSKPLTIDELRVVMIALAQHNKHDGVITDVNQHI